MQDLTKYKILVVGDGNTGKTAYLRRLITGQFDNKYYATMGVEITGHTFSSNKGEIHVVFWDTAGIKKNEGLRQGYYIGSKAAIVMADLTNRESFINIKKWLKEVREVCPDIPLVVCGNKADRKDRAIKPREIGDLVRRWKTQYYEVSAKSNYNFDKPFIYLLRKLLQDDNLTFKEDQQTEDLSSSTLPRLECVSVNDEL